MNKSIEKTIIDFLKKYTLNTRESLELIDNLYWADWDLLEMEYPNYISKIFSYLKGKNHSNEEISQILKLYNNPHGAYVEEFANIIANLYNKDKVKFIQSLNLEREEAINLVYIFRTYDIKLDEDRELNDIIKSEKLTEGEKDIAEKFIKMYKNICNT